MLSFDRVRETAQAAASLSARVAALQADLIAFASYNGAQNIAYTPATHVVTAQNAANTLTKNGHGLLSGQKGRMTNSGGALPAPLVPGLDYWIVGATANTFQLALTVGGAAIDLTGDGTGTHTFNPVPDYIEEVPGTGNLAGLLYDRTQVSNAIGSMATIVTAVAAQLANLNLLAPPQA